jgi:CHAT domain-containing protein
MFDWAKQSRSGLKLAGGEWLLLPDILSPAVDLGKSCLVTLSACETGLSEFRDMPDEFIGLPGAFLEAGAPTVVSSLWAVNDYSTSLLMGEFYRQHLAEGQGPAEALRGAQLWLRDLGRDEILNLVEPLRERAQQEDPDLFRAIDPLYWQLLQGGDEFEHPFAQPYYWGAFTASGAPS